MIGLAKLSYLQDPMSDRIFFLSATLYNAFSVICLLVPFSIQRADELRQHFEPLQFFLFKVVITQFFIWWDKYKKFTVKKIHISLCKFNYSLIDLTRGPSEPFCHLRIEFLGTVTDRILIWKGPDIISFNVFQHNIF